ncbi:MAG: transposase [Polyangiaceae bacterium]
MPSKERVESGAVAVVQRASSDVKLNPHLHVVFLDGLYAESSASESVLSFRALPHLSTTDVVDALQTARARILGYLQRRGVVQVNADLLVAPLAAERLTAGPDGLVRITLKRAFSDGTFAIDLDPLSLRGFAAEA